MRNLFNLQKVLNGRPDGFHDIPADHFELWRPRMRNDFSTLRIAGERIRQARSHQVGRLL